MKITLAAPWTDPEGKVHEADKTVDVPRDTARVLIFRGLARTPSRTAAPAANTAPAKQSKTAAKKPVEKES